MALGECQVLILSSYSGKESKHFVDSKKDTEYNDCPELLEKRFQTKLVNMVTKQVQTLSIKQHYNS